MGPEPSTEACMTCGQQKTLNSAVIPNEADSDGITITPPPEKEISPTLPIDTLQKSSDWNG
jgi:hypothetical protein